jgi:hypothetical protein
MATLSDRLVAQLQQLGAERDRIEKQTAENLAQIDAKIATLTSVSRVLTRDVEASYVALVKAGLIREIE